MALDSTDYLQNQEETKLKYSRKNGECCYDCGKYFLKKNMYSKKEPLLMKPILICDECFNKRNAK